MRNFDTIPRLVRTVDGEILSEIAIHNFEKNRQIETRILPNRWDSTCCNIDFDGVGDRDSSTLGVFGVGLAPLRTPI